ncbi:alpha/beta hydrolase [Dyella sp. C11]|uniref:alpha/beta fold hydrolase n=1 Tax=Dyella sp. C11 TaxID=2126991 RepID=UPI0013005A31|nr:alpha/beta hydrolase [Dyella sp. C11]
MRGTANKSARSSVGRQRATERLIAALLFALAATLAWGSGHAQDATCQTALAINASLQQKIIATRAGPMAYYRFGHGKPLLLVTGYRATISEWNAAFLQALATQHDVIVLENPGVGRSRADHVPETMEGMADTVSDFIDAMGLRRIDVLGWSMGGMIAQQLALDHPHQVASLVLISTTPPGSKAVPVSDAVTKTLSGQSPSPFEDIMGVLFPPDARAQAIRCFRQDMFRPGDYGDVSVDTRTAEAQSRAMNTWWHDERAAGSLARLSMPTLVMVGAKDDVLSADNSRELAKMLPHATLDESADGGHAEMYQYPVAMAGRINRFLLDTAHRWER